VDEAARDSVEDNEHFQTLWGYAKTDRRRMLLALCDSLSEVPDPVTFGLIEASLDEYRVSFPGPDALGDLLYWDMVRAYTGHIPIRRQHRYR
jgi:type I restriction enzyme M protein